MQTYPDSYVSGGEVSTTSLAPNLLQRIGRKLRLPILAMALMAFPLALVLDFLRARAVANSGARSGGGRVQEAAGTPVHTLRMPLTGKLFTGLNAMAMMALPTAVAAHVFLSVSALGADKATLASIQSWSAFLEGLRRLAVPTYLLAIALGLATIVRVFQSASFLASGCWKPASRRNQISSTSLSDRSLGAGPTPLRPS